MTVNERLLLRQLAVEGKNDQYIRENFRRIQEFMDALETSGATNISNVINNLVDPVWEKINDAVGAGATKAVDVIPVSSFNRVTYMCVVKDTGTNITKTFNIQVRYENGAVNDTVYSREGIGIDYAVGAILNGGNMELTVTNNEANNITISLGRLVQ